jgi:hypothetical protein
MAAMAPPSLKGGKHHKKHRGTPKNGDIEDESDDDDEEEEGNKLTTIYTLLRNSPQLLKLFVQS